jgi:hemerythrin-like domain-containing protein
MEDNMTNDIISTLKSDHAEILTLINAFKKGTGFQDSGWRDDLFKAKDLITKHLSLEDNTLYPAMRQNKSTEMIANAYHDEMTGITKQIFDFIDKYKEEHSGTHFSIDYAALTTALKKRIEAEETELFPKYAELVKG